jgi:putative oxidoreductase
MKSNLFSTNYQPVATDTILLITRIVTGIVFIIAGSGKIHNPMNWMGEGGYPGIFQLLAAISEYIGGMALILGFLTRLASFGIACTMIVAIYMVRFVYHAPFISPTGGIAYVLPTMLLMVALIFMATGPGRFSVDRLVFGQRPHTQLLTNP